MAPGGVILEQVNIFSIFAADLDVTAIKARVDILELILKSNLLVS
jgi:hypothetical protein